MKITPTFVAISVVCAAPFALAIRDDMTRKDRGHTFAAFDRDSIYGGDSGDGDDPGDRDDPGPAPDLDDPSLDPDPDPVPPPRNVKPGELTLIIGNEPATMGTLLEGITLGAPSATFQPDATRARIELFKLNHDLAVDYDFDDVALNGVTVRITGDEPALRDAMIDAWGTPRRIDEDHLVWLGAGSQRAVYSAVVDGFDLRFEPFTTAEDFIAPWDKTKFAVEPFPLLGAKVDKLQKELGGRLVQDYDDAFGWSAPGVGNGTGRTEITVGLTADWTRIQTLRIQCATDDTAAIRDALIVKWGPPAEDDGDGFLVWKKRGVTYQVALTDHSFSLDAAK